MEEIIFNHELMTPVMDRILIEDISKEEAFGKEKVEQEEGLTRTSGGIILTADVNSQGIKEKLSFGKVLKIGNTLSKYHLFVGDIVAIQDHTRDKDFGIKFDTGNKSKTVRFIAEIDVIAIIKGE